MLYFVLLQGQPIMNNVINLQAHRWFQSMLQTLPTDGRSLREACLEAQRQEIEHFKRLTNQK